jgi:hypothetical protein
MEWAGLETVADKKSTRRRKTGSIQSLPYFAECRPAADLWVPSRAAERVKQLKLQRWLGSERIEAFTEFPYSAGRNLSEADQWVLSTTALAYKINLAGGSYIVKWTNEKRKHHQILLCCGTGSVRRHPLGSVDDSGGGQIAGVVAE